MRVYEVFLLYDDLMLSDQFFLVYYQLFNEMLEFVSFLFSFVVVAFRSLLDV